MEERTARAAGAVSALGGLLSVLVLVPSAWFGSTPRDSYVFDPPPFSPLWIERTLVPLLAVVAGASLVVGMLALVFRDRPAAEGLRRAGGYVSVAGFLALELAGLVFSVTVGPDAGSGDLAALGGALFVLALGAVGVALAFPGMAALGVGYRRAGRETVGTALLAAPLATVGVVALSSTLLDFGSAGAPLLTAPTGVAFVAVGHELWTHPDPVTGSRSGGRLPDPEAGDRHDRAPGPSARDTAPRDPPGGSGPQRRPGDESRSPGPDGPGRPRRRDDADRSRDGGRDDADRSRDGGWDDADRSRDGGRDDADRPHDGGRDDDGGTDDR